MLKRYDPATADRLSSATVEKQKEIVMRKAWIAVGAMALAVGCTQMNGKKGECKEKGEACEKKEEGNEVKMTLADVPPAVRDTLTREAGGAKIESVDKEMKNGQTIYETDVMMNGQNWEIKVDPSGKVISKKVDNESEEKGEKKKGKEEDDEKEEKEKK
jgi:uncharacterized membrane protein YkoI